MFYINVNSTLSALSAAVQLKSCLFFAALCRLVKRRGRFRGDLNTIGRRQANTGVPRLVTLRRTRVVGGASYPSLEIAEVRALEYFEIVVCGYAWLVLEILLVLITVKLLIHVGWLGCHTRLKVTMTLAYSVQCCVIVPGSTHTNNWREARPPPDDYREGGPQWAGGEQRGARGNGSPPGEGRH